MKRCTKCQVEKPTDAFSRSKTGKDGLYSQCRECKKTAKKEWDTLNKEHIKIYVQKQYREKGKANNAARYARYRDKFLERRRREYEKNRERSLETSRQWKKSHKDMLRDYERQRYLRDGAQMLARNKLWRQKNLERRAENEARRRARLRGNGVERVNYPAICERDRWLCHICGKRVSKRELSFDHLIPIVHDGPHTENNLRVAHRRCNSRRGAGTLPAQLFLFTEVF